MKVAVGSGVASTRLLLFGMLFGCLAACGSRGSLFSPAPPNASPSAAPSASIAAGGEGCNATTGTIVVQGGNCMPSGASSGTQYVVYWENDSPLSDIPAGVTIVDIAFGGVNGHTITAPDGGFGSSLTSDIASLHAKGVKVLLSLGGEGGTFSYDGNASGFESSLASTMQTYGYDGVDFDDEDANDAQRVSDLTTLVPAARTALGSSKLITYAAFGDPSANSADDGAVLQNAQVVSAISYLDVMSYAGGNVSTTEGYVTAYAGYMPKNKTLLSVDFDGDQGGAPSAAALSSFASWVLSNGYAGMMAWQVSSAQKSGSLSAIATDLNL